MRDRPGALAQRLIAAPAILLALGAASPQTGVDITVTVTGLRNADGVVRACMTHEPASFPKCRGVEGAQGMAVPVAESDTLTFRNVRPGRYAIALLHDENDNGKADRAALMIPSEGFGFSRDARVRMGPPRFEDAAFDVAGKPQALSIRMRYVL
ncbi:DUF2141 domain-containing protein [Qipengyuania spongiae]|uniref:DUF2141 domain-containing protein n=1 Tax=Qipengyuania spongiae TaxID=2909673 RepID=A0ABY5T614_9SPHN|nr:DUF2141 domain-containing protein [Qipengyuania spongiae]UVI40726.1 DUF2141 domain-containing protein [Qipengyuania spongiae]